MVTRYNYSEGDMGMIEDVYGVYVMDADYATLEAENTRLKEALRSIRDAKTYGECAVAIEKAREVLGDASSR